MTFEEANHILDLAEQIGAAAGPIVNFIVNAFGAKDATEIRAQRDAISVDTHEFIKAERERLKDL